MIIILLALGAVGFFAWALCVLAGREDEDMKRIEEAYLKAKEGQEHER